MSVELNRSKAVISLAFVTVHNDRASLEARNKALYLV